MQKRKVQELKIQAALFGIEIPDENAADKKKAKIEAEVDDPLRNFPNDVTYCSVKDCDAKIRLSEQLKKRPIESQWDNYRKECCLGNYGVIARRCSVNDVLWGRYLKIKEAGATLTIDQVKAMVEFDIVRRKLYPANYKGTGSESPPKEYTEELQRSGEYTKILQRLDDITRRMQN